MFECLSSFRFLVDLSLLVVIKCCVSVRSIYILSSCWIAFQSSAVQICITIGNKAIELHEGNRLICGICECDWCMCVCVYVFSVHRRDKNEFTRLSDTFLFIVQYGQIKSTYLNSRLLITIIDFSFRISL